MYDWQLIAAIGIMIATATLVIIFTTMKLINNMETYITGKFQRMIEQVVLIQDKNHQCIVDVREQNIAQLTEIREQTAVFRSLIEERSNDIFNEIVVQNGRHAIEHECFEKRVDSLSCALRMAIDELRELSDKCKEEPCNEIPSNGEEI